MFPTFVGKSMDAFLHDEDVAKLFKMTMAGLRNKIDSGDPLPPFSKLPGLRVRLWPKKEFEEWVRQFIVGQGAVAGSHFEKRRGRPRSKGQTK